MVKCGIDVSKWQADIDWEKVKKWSGIDFAILRSGSGVSTDPRFAEYVFKATRYGIMIPAVYHFMYSTSIDEAKQEARIAVNNVKKAFGPNVGRSVIIFADWEYASLENAKKKGVNLARTQVVELVCAFCGQVEELGFEAGIYCNMDYYRNVFTEKAIFDTRYLWLADWKKIPLCSPDWYKTEPSIPCDFHQISDKGIIHGINGYVDLDVWYDEEERFKMGVTSKEVLDLARNWIGYNEHDGSHKQIIDIYNAYKPLARGYKVKYTDSWCDTFISALFIKLNAVDAIGGTECGCEEHIKKFRAAGIWEEDGRIVPEVGDIILFNWDTNMQQNNGYADHIGIVETVNGSSIETIEGNYKDAVTRRRINVGWGYIRGFAKPKYSKRVEENKIPVEALNLNELADQVIRGQWGNGEERIKNLKTLGVDPAVVQKIVNDKLGKITQVVSIDEIADEVIAGKWGNGKDRKESLEAAGYNYDEVQRRVNAKLNA